MNILELSEQEIVRRNNLQQLKDMGIEPFPAAEYPVDAWSTDIISEFVDLPIIGKDEEGNDLDQSFIIARALDEITNMKILSRIEGDETKVSEQFLKELSEAIKEQLKIVCGEYDTEKSISLAKLKEMKGKLSSGYTSFWS